MKKESSVNRDTLGQYPERSKEERKREPFGLLSFGTGEKIKICHQTDRQRKKERRIFS